jgi:hypothetical protein
VTLFTELSSKNPGQSQGTNTGYDSKVKEIPSRFRHQRSLFSETKNLKKTNEILLSANLTHNINQGLTDINRRGKDICARISQEGNSVIIQSKLAQRRLVKELLVKTKNFLIFFKTLNLPKEYLFDLPLKPFTHLKSRAFFDAIKLGNNTKVKEMYYSISPLLIYEFDHVRQTGLHIAAKRNDKAMVATLLGLGAKANTPDLFHRPALHYAIENQNANVVYLLLVSGGSPWSTKGSNFQELARNNSVIKNYIKKFRHLSIMLRINPLARRESLRRQFLAVKITTPQSLRMFN